MTTTETAVDWDVLALPGVESICENASHRVAEKYRGVIEWADLRQEAFILCATNPEIVRDYILSLSGGFLNHWLYLRLLDVADRENRHHKNTVPLSQFQRND